MTYVGAVPTTGDFKKLDAITASATATYNLTQGGVAVFPQSSSHCLVVLNGILQTGGSSFNIVNDTIVFAEALTSSDVINQILVLGNVNDIGVPSDDTVSTAKIQADAINATKIADDSISDEHLDITAITGQTAITSLADTDKFLVSDASDSGNLKYVEKQYLPSGNLVKITSGNWGTGTDTLSLSNIFTTTYKHYIFYLTNVIPSSNAGVNMQFETGGGGSYVTGSDYHYVLTGRDAGGNLTNTQDNNSSNIEFQAQAITGGHGSKRGNYIVDFFNPMDGNCYTTTNTQATYHDSDGYTEFNKGAGVYLSNTAVTGFRVLLSSGTIETFTAPYVVYGLKS